MTIFFFVFAAMAVAGCLLVRDSMNKERDVNTERLIIFGVPEDLAKKIVKYYTKFVWGKGLASAVNATAMIQSKGFVLPEDYVILMDHIPSLPKFQNNGFADSYSASWFLNDLSDHIDKKIKG